MTIQQERRHLAQANRHIAKAKEHVARQKLVIKKLVEGGHDVHVAQSLLHAMEGSLSAYEQHRELILQRLQNGED
jgi:hypothetical protein